VAVETLHRADRALALSQDRLVARSLDRAVMVAPDKPTAAVVGRLYVVVVDKPGKKVLTDTADPMAAAAASEIGPMGPTDMVVAVSCMDLA
jgi:hypothetical protein